MQAFETALDKRHDQRVPTWFLMYLLKQVLTGNIFEFDGEYFVQRIGTTMGTRIAPTYAIIFMDWLEDKKILQT